MSWSGQASEHDADHGKTNEGRGGSRVALEVTRDAAIVADPSEGSSTIQRFGKTTKR